MLLQETLSLTPLAALPTSLPRTAHDQARGGTDGDESQALNEEPALLILHGRVPLSQPSQPSQPPQPPALLPDLVMPPDLVSAPSFQFSTFNHHQAQQQQQQTPWGLQGQSQGPGPAQVPWGEGRQGQAQPQHAQWGRVQGEVHPGRMWDLLPGENLVGSQGWGAQGEEGGVELSFQSLTRGRPAVTPLSVSGGDPGSDIQPRQLRFEAPLAGLGSVAPKAAVWGEREWQDVWGLQGGQGGQGMWGVQGGQGGFEDQGLAGFSLQLDTEYSHQLGSAHNQGQHVYQEQRVYQHQIQHLDPGQSHQMLFHPQIEPTDGGDHDNTDVDSPTLSFLHPPQAAESAAAPPEGSAMAAHGTARTSRAAAQTSMGGFGGEGVMGAVLMGGDGAPAMDRSWGGSGGDDGIGGGGGEAFRGQGALLEYLMHKGMQLRARRWGVCMTCAG